MLPIRRPNFSGIGTQTRRVSVRIGLVAASMLGIFACSALDPLLERDRVAVQEDFVYRAGSENPKHRLDLFTPRGVADFPTAVFIHGGFWRNQDKRYYRPILGLYWNVGLALARRGVAVAVINYRLHPDASIDEQIDDVRFALDWVRANIRQHGGDAEHLYLIGHSAGGHLASLVGADAPSGVRGVIALSPILDIEHMARVQPPEFNEETTYPIFGRESARWGAYSPAVRWKATSPPLALVIGSDDFGFIRDEVRELYAARVARGVRCELQELSGFSHSDLVLSIGRGDDPVAELATDFIRRNN
jgi:acetyl esterase/lipase